MAICTIAQTLRSLKTALRRGSAIPSTRTSHASTTLFRTSVTVITPTAPTMKSVWSTTSGANALSHPFSILATSQWIAHGANIAVSNLVLITPGITCASHGITSLTLLIALMTTGVLLGLTTPASSTQWLTTVLHAATCPTVAGVKTVSVRNGALIMSATIQHLLTVAIHMATPDGYTTAT